MLDPKSEIKNGNSEPVVDETAQELLAIQRPNLRDPMIDQITALSNAAELIEARGRYLEQLRGAALKNVSPSDWTIFKDRDGNEVGMVSGGGSEKIAQFYGIRIFNVRPVDDIGCFSPKEIVAPSGKKGLRAWFDATNQIDHRILETEEVTVWEGENFTGRAGNEGDLRVSLRTRMTNRAARKFAAAARVPRVELEKILGDPKLFNQCRKGSGFGTSSDRGAERVAEGDLTALKKELWDELVRFANGNHETAKATLKRITSYPSFKNSDGKTIKAFEGMISIDGFTRADKIQKTIERLHKDKEYKAWLEDNPPLTESDPEPGQSQGDLV